MHNTCTTLFGGCTTYEYKSPLEIGNVAILFGRYYTHGKSAGHASTITIIMPNLRDLAGSQPIWHLFQTTALVILSITVYANIKDELWLRLPIHELLLAVSEQFAAAVAARTNGKWPYVCMCRHIAANNSDTALHLYVNVSTGTAHLSS